MGENVRIAASSLALSCGKLRVHDQHAVVAGLHRGVAAGADEHVDVALDVQHLHLHRIEVLRRGLAAGRAGLAGDPRCEAVGGQRRYGDGRERRGDRGLHRGACFILSMNSGYIVSAPPLMAMSGSLKRSLNSL